MMKPSRHECHACCLLRAEKASIQPATDNMHDTCDEQARRHVIKSSGARNSLSIMSNLALVNQKNCSHA